MAGKGLNSLARSNVPKLGKSITSTGDEDVLVGRVDADRHHVAEVIRKFRDLGAGLNIPQHTGHVSRGSDDAAIIDEAAAGQVTRVTRQLPSNASGTFARGQVVNGTDVVKTTASHVVSTGRVGARHDPRGAQRDGVDLVRSVGVPDDQLAVL